jgi:hypothetical protein
MLLLFFPVLAIGPISRSAAATHAAALRDRGFTVLAEPILEASLISKAAVEVTATLDGLLNEVSHAGFNSRDQQYLFHEVCYRQRGRWDVRKPPRTEAPAWAEVCKTARAAAVVPILEELQGPKFGELATLMSGAIVSRAAPAQRPHADADLQQFEIGDGDDTYRTFSCFIPLVDLHGSGGDGTQFWPGSHVNAAAAEAAWERATADGWEELLQHSPGGVGAEAPACRAGGVVLYDSRIIHGGLPSCGRTRAIAYLIVGTGGAQDSNFPLERICDGLDPDDFPFWEELIFVQ